MLFQGQVVNAVPSTRSSAGTPNAMQLPLGELGMSEVLPRYAALAWAGQVFSAAQTAVAALTAVGTTTTGLTLWNPTGSGKNLVIIDVTVGITPATLATVGVQVMLGGATQAATPTFGSALTPSSCFVGSSFASVAKAGTGSTTIAASPIGFRCVGSWESTVLSTNGGAVANASIMKDEVAGALIVAPGAVITLFGIGTVADATVNAAFTWAEIPT